VENPALADLSQHMNRPQDELLRLLLMFDDDPSDEDDITGLEDEWVDED
jgi:hypothetical protein